MFLEVNQTKMKPKQAFFLKITIEADMISTYLNTVYKFCAQVVYLTLANKFSDCNLELNLMVRSEVKARLTTSRNYVS